MAKRKEKDLKPELPKPKAEKVVKQKVTLSKQILALTWYGNMKDDAMVRSLKKQYPHLKVTQVYADSFRDHEGNVYEFDCSDTGYNMQTAKGKKDIVVEFWKVN